MMHTRSTPKRIHPVRELMVIVGVGAGLLLGGYVALGWVARVAVDSFSYEKEKEVFGEILKLEGPKEAELAETQKYLGNLLERLRAGEPPEMRLAEISILCDSRPNAFALPGGRLYVTHRLLDYVKNEIGLAFVVAHELGHFKHRHAMRGLGRKVIVMAIANLLFADASTILQLLADTTFFLGELSFSRDQERESDEYAIARVKEAFESLEGAEEFFAALKDKEKEGFIPDFLSTHPGADERIERIRVERAKLAPNQSPPAIPESATAKPQQICGDKKSGAK